MSAKLVFSFAIVAAVCCLCDGRWSSTFWDSFFSGRNNRGRYGENQNSYAFGVVKPDFNKREWYKTIQRDNLCSLLYAEFPYICADRSWCLAEYQICDGDVTCTDGSDEKDCEDEEIVHEVDEESSGDQTEYGKDIKAYYDNTGCAAMLPQYPYRCSRTENLCLGEKQICDGLSQCQENNDEIDCDYGYGETAKCKAPVSKGSLGRNDLIIQIMDAHNYFRCLHGVGPLGWDDKLAQVAQSVAEDNANLGFLKHSYHGYGENLAMTQVSDIYHVSGIGITKMWYDEIQMYNFDHQGFSASTGHFTQLMWADTTNIGCGVATQGKSIFVACEYNPPGNVYGQYDTNVFSPLSDGP
ncbi:uncharacterized protein LOC144440338 isoform X2 [Glandiceps talaboti]